MTIDWCTIHTADLQQSKRFYGELLGLSLQREFSPEDGMEIVFYSAENGMQIELIHKLGARSAECGGGISLGIVVSNYQELLSEFQESGLISSGPMALGNGMECFFVRDPDGIEIQIVRRDSMERDQ